MQGVIISISPDGQKTEKILSKAAELAELREAIGGGWLEHVPGFSTLKARGPNGVEGVVRCVAFCDEYGKTKSLRVNVVATALWELALARAGVAEIDDVLCGPVAIVFGDNEFMEEL